MPPIRSSRRVLPILLALLTAALVLPPAADAQYFGRNKVQYEEFDWRVVSSDHFDVYVYDRIDEAASADGARMMERWYDRLSGVFDHTFDESRPLILYADKPDFQQTNTTPSLVSEGTGGFTEGLKNRIVLPLAETIGATDHVLGHELVHAFQFDLARGEATRGGQGLQSLPLWVVEGLAEYLSIGSTDPHTAMWLRDAVLQDEFPTLDDLSRDPRYFPYRFGHAFWAWVAGVYGDRRVVSLYRSMARAGVAEGIRETLRTSPDSLGAAWKADVEEAYRPLLDGRTPPADVGRRILTGESGDEDWMLAPTLSPDGRLVAFLSERDLFTIDLFLADVRTGEVLGKLGSSARSPHFDALAFLNTSGTWSPDGERFAFVTAVEGDNGIAVADVGRREVVRTYHPDDVGAVYSLAWSPDGRSIAFSGAAGGVTDLFRLDVESGGVERLTDDRWAELHPAWSPDGATIAFATDRNGARALERLDPPAMGLGFLDVASGSVRVERPFGDVKHVNPQYGPGGRSLWLVAAPDGVPDVYRIDLASGATFRVTRVATGVSGITDLSPALSVARGSGDLAFSVFAGGDYVGRGLAAADAGGRPFEPPREPVAAALPPLERIGVERVARYRAEPTEGLPSARAFEVADYDPDLSLDYIAPPTAGVAVDRTGVAVGGSIGFFFSDMLGDRQVALGVQASGGVQDIGGEVLYADLEDRWNWGVRGGRIPFRSAITGVSQDEIDGVPVRRVDLIIERTILNRGSFLVEYPFSPTRRVETDVGYTRYGFDREVIPTFIFPDGSVARGERVDLPAPDPLDIGHASAAWVEDWSFFGFTSPIRGGRARFEVEGNVGSLDFATVLADWRRYIFANPVTFAFRGLHLGRYPDGDLEELTPLFVGYSSLVRGYDPESFDGEECTPVPGDLAACPEFDRLIGSRIAVANAELRVPLVGTEEFGLLSGGFLPVELSLFTDAGLAWTSDDEPELELARESEARIPVFSSGASLRVNLLGALVGEVFWAYPWQRPEAGGQWGFQLRPGW